MEETKEIKLTGEAAESFIAGRKTRRVSRRNNKTGMEQPSGVKVNKVESPSVFNVPTNVPANVPLERPLERSVNVAQERPANVPTNVPANVPTPLETPLQTQEAGASKKPIKVILTKKEKPKEKVILAPAKEKPSPVKIRSKTQKASRRIRVSLDTLSSRMNRAKTIKKESQNHSLEVIKKALSKAGLIKPDSKAPEKILRQMYSDFEQLKQKAL
jgi:hypothetical protein